MENNNDILNPLGKIQKVDAPLFMLTTIEARISQATSEWILPNKVRSVSVAFLLLVLLNTFAILQIRSGSPKERNIAKVFQLMPNNNLYE